MTSTKIKIVCFVLGIICAITWTSKAFAESSSGRGDALYNFLKLAFTDKTWNEDRPLTEFKKRLATLRPLDAGKNNGDKAKIGLTEKENWINRYGDTSAKLPDNGVIHKWDGQITIGLGKPFDLKYIGNEGVEQHYKLIEERINNLAPDLKKITGRSIELIPPSQEKEDNYGLVRIIPTHNVNDAFTYMSFSGPPLIASEAKLWGAELFDTVNKNDMRGFIIPQANNNIGLVVCKINIKLEPDNFKKLVDECLLRSMGLPGSWGAEEATVLDNRNRILNTISILYCPDIKSGMSKNKALYALSHSNQCNF